MVNPLFFMLYWRMSLRNYLKKIKQIKLTKKQIVWIIILIAIIIAVGILYFIGKDIGWFSVFDSEESLRHFVESFGAWAPLVFFVLQFFQVIFAPIPGAVTTVVGGMLFGFWKGLLISFSAVFLGSVCAFLLGKIFGRPLAERIAGKEAVAKYLSTVSLRQRVMLFLMFLLPFFPDDLICIITGLTAMKVRTFMLIVLFSRPWGFAIFSLLGTKALSLPFYIWLIIGILAVAILIIAMKYAPSIEERVRIFLDKKYRKN